MYIKCLDYISNINKPNYKFKNAGIQDGRHFEMQICIFVNFITINNQEHGITI